MASARTQMPGPAGWPVIGSLSAIGRDPLVWLTGLQREHGDLLSFHVGPIHRVIVSDPVLIEDLLVRLEEHTTKDDLTKRLSDVLGQGLLTDEGEHWRTQRRRIAPSFTPKQVAGYGADMVRSAVGRLPEDGPLDVHALTSAIALDVVIRVLFGAEPGSEASKVGELLVVMMEAFETEMTTVWRLVPQWVPGPHRSGVARVVAELDRILTELVARARAEGSGDHLLQRLLQAKDTDGKGMNDKELRDELVTLFLAGHETTAIAVASALWLLAEHPEHQERLFAEVDALGRDPLASDKLPFTDAVVDESMRLYPPAWGIGRQVEREFVLGGYRVAAGTQIAALQWIVHRDPRWWVGADRFRPDRWLNGETQGLPRFAYFPFGGGPRICVGNHFAKLEARLLLATLVHHRRWEVLPGAVPEWLPAVTLRPRHGLHLVAKGRPA